MLRRLAVTTAVIAALVAVAGPKLVRRTLRPPLMPIPHTPDDLGLAAEDVWLRSPTGTRVHAWFMASQDRAPAVIVMHGWTANAGLMLPLAAPLRAAGFHTLFLDGRGHGLSEPDEFAGAAQFAEDIEAALDWLLEDPRVESVGVLGHSAGASAALLAASRRDEIAAVVAVSAVADPRLIRWGMIPPGTQHALMSYIARRTGYEVDELVPLNRMSHIAAPVLIVHGEQDRIVPVHHAHLLADAERRVELLLLPDADHTSLEKFAPSQPAVIGFLGRHLAARSPAGT